MARFLSIALLSLCYIASAQADIYSASSALSRGDYETAVAEFSKLAEKGDASAQANLGYMYYAGEGVPQDYEKAVYWYRKAATQGNKDAQYNLAVSYAFGEGTKQDLTEAAIWYRRAGEQGHVVSQYSLGISYAYGEGVPQDPEEAARWFKKAAEQGYARAQVQLGSMYHTGEGLEQDYVEAARWYRMAADRGDATAQYNLGTMYRSGKGVEQNYAQAKRWFRQSADQGYAAAQNELASLERSAAANIATRTIQTKPELPSVTETIPEPVAEIVEKPKEEKVTVQKTESTPSVQTSSPEISESKKKPLFSVEKEGLLSLDDSELDIAKSEVVVETEIEKEVVAPVETNIEKNEIVEITEKDDSSAIHNAPGLPNPTETNLAEEEPESSEGFFSRLFSRKESSEPDTTVTEEIAETIEEKPVVEEVIPEIKVKKEVVITPKVYPEDIKKAELAALEKNKVDEVEAEVTMDEPVTEDTESGGFFSRLFSSKESPEPDISITEESTEIIEDETVANEIIPEPKIKKEVVITPRVYPEDIKAAELATKEKTEVIEAGVIPEKSEPNKITELSETRSDDNAIHKALGLPSPGISEETKPSSSFFDTLFSRKENPETDTVPTEEITEFTEEEPVIETVPEPEVTEEELVIVENNWAKEEKESSGGLFSAIGDFFSGGDKTEQAELNQTETESDDILIAKVEEPVPVVEEIELAQEAEIDLSQYSVQAGRRALTNGDYDEAYKQFKPLAEAGDSEAQSHLGSLYYVGKGVPKDLNEAYNWYKKSADQENMDAQYSVGNMYLLGEGVEQNNAEAAKWYALASEQGHVAAKNNLKSLEKLETLNRENQLKLDALAAEQKAKEEATPKVENKSEEVATLDEQTTETDSETTIEEEKPGLLGLLGGLFDSKSAENEATEEVADNVVEVNSEAINNVEVVELESPEIKTKPEALSTESLQTLTNEEATEETEQSNSIAAIDNSQSKTSESPSFFKSLFGSDDVEKTTTVNSIDLEATEEIETIDVDLVESEEVVAIETEAKEAVSEQEDLAVTTNEVESTEESDGLFGFLGNVFSSKNKDSHQESETTEDIAMLKTETEQATSNIDETVVEELAEEVIEKTEAERLRPLATQGDQDAQYRLGALYYSGSDVKQDYSQAALWYRRAAEQGNVDAQYSLGNMFLMGEGIGQDDDQAAHWYALAAEQGHSSAKHNLDSLRKTQVSNSQIETETTNSGQLISLDDEQFSEATTSEDTTGKTEYEQGLAYAFGDGVPQNDRTAFNLFYEAAEKGYVLAQYKLGVAFAYGEGVRQDPKKAVEWYRKAAEQGYTIAQRNLATMYLDGNGVEQNKVQALAWYQVVANAGNAMDLRRRDMLKKELSEVELSESMELSEQISSRIANPSL